MTRSSERPDGSGRTSSGKTGSDELARVVRERRESLGWTRQQLADATGIPYPTIAQIETAYRGVSPSRLGVIARVLGLDPKELYDVLASEGEAAGAAPPMSAPPARGRSAQRFRAAGSWHDNPGFAAAAPASPVGRPSLAAPSQARAARSALPSAAAGDAPMAADPASLTHQPLRNELGPSDVVDQVVDLLSLLPAGDRIDALSQVQSHLLERIVQERVDEAGRTT